MKIGLIDVDHHNYPNLALMKISAYHKDRGDDVTWYDCFQGHFDKVYVSKVFTFSQDYNYPIDSDVVIRGGTGYDLDNCLPEEIEHCYPDYSIYGIKNTAYGYLTRGCPRHCDFCVVGDKEGLVSRKVADLNEFWNGEKNIVLNDPNILACKECRDLLRQLEDSKSWVDFNQGLDIRMMTEDKAAAISRIKIKEIHFAWDKIEDEQIIIPKLELFAKFSKKPHSHNAIVYVLVNFNTTIEQDLYRVYTLRKIGYWAYIMIYDKEHCEPIYKKLQRWVNNRFIFAKCDNFNDYLNKNYNKNEK